MIHVSISYVRVIKDLITVNAVISIKTTMILNVPIFFLKNDKL